jgi:hypothetical protein
MNSKLFGRFDPIAWMVAGFVILILVSSASVEAQNPPVGRTPTVINPRLEDRNRQLSEGRLRSAEIGATAETENQKHVRDAITHMREDFKRIQVLRNDIARDLVARKLLNYSLVAEQTAEINKRANGLNVYMLAHGSENKEQETQLDVRVDDMTGALVRLCKTIDSFTENPALKDASTVDAKKFDKAKEQKARADTDLLTIIKLSEHIKKKAESLKDSQ